MKLQRNSTFISALLNGQAKLPRYIRIAKDFIMGERPGDAIERLRALDEMHDCKEFSYRWEEELQYHRSVNDAILNLHELPCAVWAFQINLNRIMVALDPLAEDARILEEETLELAEKILEWWSTSAQLEGERDDRLYTFPIPSAQIAIQTRYEWQAAVEGRPGYVDIERGVVDRRVFETYTTLIRAKAPTRKVSAAAVSAVERILTGILRSTSTLQGSS
jgi:hypothetical protein